MVVKGRRRVHRPWAVQTLSGDVAFLQREPTGNGARCPSLDGLAAPAHTENGTTVDE